LQEPQEDQEEFEGYDADGDAQHAEALGREITGQDQQHGHRENSLEDSPDVMDGDISPDNLVDGKRLEGNGPGNNDVWQEDRYLPNELARDGSLEADEIRREQR